MSVASSVIVHQFKYFLSTRSNGGSTQDDGKRDGSVQSLCHQHIAIQQIDVDHTIKLKDSTLSTSEASSHLGAQIWWDKVSDIEVLSSVGLSSIYTPYSDYTGWASGFQDRARESTRHGYSVLAPIERTRWSAIYRQLKAQEEKESSGGRAGTRKELQKTWNSWQTYPLPQRLSLL